MVLKGTQSRFLRMRKILLFGQVLKNLKMREW